MSMTDARSTISLSLLGCLFALPAAADPTFFSTGNPDGLMATATRPESAGNLEVEFSRRLHSQQEDLNHRRDFHRPADRRRPA